MKVCRVLLISAAVVFSHLALSQALLPAPSNIIKSPYGPRQYAPSPFHGGVDFAGAKDEPTKAATTGALVSIKSDNDKCGNRVFLDLGDLYPLVYCHLFAYVPASGERVDSSNKPQYTFVRNLPYSFKPAKAKVGKQIAKTIVCNAVLVRGGPTKLALVATNCAWPEGSTVKYGDEPQNDFTVRKQVQQGDIIGVVGSSGLTGTAPHYHLQRSRTSRPGASPFEAVTNPAMGANTGGRLCASLKLASTSPCDGSPLIVVKMETLVKMAYPYFDVLVDDTDTLDLDSGRFAIPGLAPRSYPFHYGGSRLVSPMINGMTGTEGYISAISLHCSDAPPSGKIVVCPTSSPWNPGMRHITTFRLGLDLSNLTVGDQVLSVSLSSILVGARPLIQLPFTLENPPEFHIEFDANNLGGTFTPTATASLPAGYPTSLPIPTGTVRFTDQGGRVICLATMKENGFASCNGTLSSLPFTVKAEYLGDKSWSPNSRSVTGNRLPGHYYN